MHDPLIRKDVFIIALLVRSVTKDHLVQNVVGTGGHLALNHIRIIDLLMAYVHLEEHSIIIVDLLSDLLALVDVRFYVLQVHQELQLKDLQAQKE